MKKILLYTLTVLMLGVISCTKDNPEKANSTEEEVVALAGSWGLVHMECRETLNGEQLDNIDKSLNPDNPNDEDDQLLIIKDDGDNRFMITNFSWDTEASSWKKNEAGEVQYELKDNKLYFNSIVEVAITSLSQDTLILEYDENYTVSGTVIYESHLKATYKRGTYAISDSR